MKKTNKISKKSRLSAKVGSNHDEPIYVGKNENKESKLDIFLYSKDTFNEVHEIEQIPEDLSNLNVWVSLSGINNIELVNKICQKFNIHFLVQEDILNTQQRTKVEEIDNSIFITLRHLHSTNNGLESEQISVVLFKNIIITFKEEFELLIEPIKDKLRNNIVQLRQKETDYLFYKILDTLVDNYFVVIDNIGDKVESIEEETLYYPNSKTTYKIQDIKKELLLINKNIVPLREVLNKLESDFDELIENRNRKYFRDVYDHTFQAYETLESYKILISDLLNIYFATTGNKLNNVMKVLTIISTIFIPLSFIASVFGMNFKYFPGMDWQYSYYLFWVICIAGSVGMLFYFKIKKWF